MSDSPQVRTVPFDESATGGLHFLGHYIPEDRHTPGSLAHQVLHGVKRRERVLGMAKLEREARAALVELRRATGAVDVIPMAGRKIGVVPGMVSFLERVIPRGMVLHTGVLQRVHQLPGFLAPSLRFQPSIREHMESMEVVRRLIRRVGPLAIVVDDVFNQGRTMRAAIRLLGRERVRVVPFVLAKTPRPLPGGHEMDTSVAEWVRRHRGREQEPQLARVGRAAARVLRRLR